MYHINHEGKIYPCRAKVRSCPYGTAQHAESKEELYYKLMKLEKKVTVPLDTMKQINSTGRLRSLHTLSESLENGAPPIETILSSLENSLETSRSWDFEVEDGKWEGYEDVIAKDIARAMEYGEPIPSTIPYNIREKGKNLFAEEYGGRRRYSRVEMLNFSHAGREAGKRRTVLSTPERLRSYEEYEEYSKFKLTKDNYESSVGWVEEDFLQFSHDLNTSKMITQPVFYGDITKAENIIKEMDNYELLAAYDDYLVPDEEIEENVQLANNFEYKPRHDLSLGANQEVSQWYNRNKKIYTNWKRSRPQRMLLSMKMANELDERNIYRQDNAPLR